MTKVALERLLASVNANMSFQMPIATKCFTACATNETQRRALIEFKLKRFNNLKERKIRCHNIRFIFHSFIQKKTEILAHTNIKIITLTQKESMKHK